MSSHYNDLQEYSKTKLRTFQEEVKSKFLTDESYADHASHMVVDQLVDEIVLEVVAEYHRAVVKGMVHRFNYLLNIVYKYIF